MVDNPSLTSASATEPASGAKLMAANTLRQANSPYPGLRPFLDFEDMLMHGRQVQVADVVRRLGRLNRAPTELDAARPAAPALGRFVAVVGGSGSGKSSLLRAGVVPFLRQFGIPEAGDLWESVVATPGTNFQPDADGTVRESPITRLAAKFERVLQGEHSVRRCEALAQMLRRDGGLGRLVDEFGPQLALPPGVRPEDACVLIVIDQFEELFHKTNAGSADARAMVERVIDHFHEAKQGQGSRKCFLAITMRSEHLNDCAGYLGLPEAINSGGYLVGRLGEAQLREVIEKPAQRYLRLRQRERQSLARRATPDELAALPALPRTVAFEVGVVDSLVAATSQIHHDPDHLPLLQHALARTWAVACAREGLPESGVPGQVLLSDLWRAGQADVDPPAAPAAGSNLLRLSLNSWAELALRSHADTEQPQLLELMRRLAYKDLRTGNFNQQRLYVAQHPLGEAALKALLQGRWIDAVDYLYWDDEDPQRVTLKVSHESFIRGWATLRKLAELEATRLDRFMQLLEATQDWLQHDKAEHKLLEQQGLDRVAEYQLQAALGPPHAAHDDDPDTATWQDWQRWLAQLPRGESLRSIGRQQVRTLLRRSVDQLAQQRAQREALVQAEADAEMALAQAAQREARAKVLRLRKSRQRWVLTMVTLVGSFGAFVLWPINMRSQDYFNAAHRANLTDIDHAQAVIGGNLPHLVQLQDAANFLRLAKSPDDWWMRGLARVADEVLTWPPLNQLKLASLLADAQRAVEPGINEKLRQAITQSLWLADAGPASSASPDQPPCQSGQDDSGQWVQATGSQSTQPWQRRIVIDPPTRQSPANRLVYAASAQTSAAAAAPDACSQGRQLGRQVLSLPAQIEPRLMLDKRLDYMVMAQPPNDAQPGQPATLSVRRLRWHGPGNAELEQPAVAVIWGDEAADKAMRSQVAGSLGLANEAATPPGTPATLVGRVLAVGGQHWRLVSAQAQALTAAPGPLSPSGTSGTAGTAGTSATAGTSGKLGPLQSLAQAQGEDTCLRITAALKTNLAESAAAANSSALDWQTLSHGGSCLVIQREPMADRADDGRAPARAQGEAVATVGRDRVSVQVFNRPAAGGHFDQGGLLLTSLAHIDFGPVPRQRRQWQTGAPQAAWDGWLILAPDGQAPEPGALGLPFSTAAWAQLARQIREDHCKAARGLAMTQPAGCAPG